MERFSIGITRNKYSDVLADLNLGKKILIVIIFG